MEPVVYQWLKPRNERECWTLPPRPLLICTWYSWIPVCASVKWLSTVSWSVGSEWSYLRQFCNPGMCPDWQSNLWYFGLQASAQSAEPHQLGWFTPLNSCPRSFQLLKRYILPVFLGLIYFDLLCVTCVLSGTVIAWSPHWQSGTLCSFGPLLRSLTVEHPGAVLALSPYDRPEWTYALFYATKSGIIVH